LANRRRSRRRHDGGFALIETGLVLLIVVLAAALLATLLGRVQQRRHCDRFAADLREFSAAFESYARLHKGGFPSTAGDGVVPAGMESLLKDTSWSGGSPFGGDYGWVAREPPSAGPGSAQSGSGAIVLTAFSPRFPLALSRHDLLYIDAKIDDGNLATGRFRTGFNGWPVYLVGERR